MKLAVVTSGEAETGKGQVSLPGLQSLTSECQGVEPNECILHLLNSLPCAIKPSVLQVSQKTEQETKE